MRKNPKDFFKNEPDLLERDSVQELISYIRDLEYETYENKLDSSFNKEDDMRQLLVDIKTSLDQSVNDEADELTDYHHMLLNLKKYFYSYLRERKLNL